MPPQLRPHLADRIAYSDPSGPAGPRELQALARSWATQWRIPLHYPLASIDYCTQAPARLGELELETNTIWLNGPYLTLHPELLQESLCHQLAHWIVWRYARGQQTDPTREWLRLMMLAGYRGSARCELCRNASKLKRPASGPAAGSPHSKNRVAA
jgi:hypothetical protein